MFRHRLQSAFESFDPNQIDSYFGEQLNQLSVVTSQELAPVKRVAIFTEAFVPKIDGVSKSTYLTLRYLQRTGREVIVFAPDIAPPNIGPSRVVRLPSFTMPLVPETRVATPFAPIGRILNDFKPDMIHLFSPEFMAMSGIDAARRLKIPVIANYQTDIPAYLDEHYGLKLLSDPFRRWLTYQHNRCHLTLVGSNATMKAINNWGIRRTRLWKRGVDLKRFSPQRRSELWRLRLLNGKPEGQTLRCLYVGRVAPEKRIDLLLEVAKMPNVALTIVGDGASREELEQRFAGTGTHFTGYLYGDALSQAYASADVFLFPGPSETFGQVVQEAMASGLPCIIVNQGGIVDLVEPGVNGFHCPLDAEAFRHAVQTLLDNPDLRHKMAAASRKRAASSPWESVMHQLEGYYNEAVELNRRLLMLRGERMTPPASANPWQRNLHM